METPPRTPIKDRFARPLKSLRLSITDRCNFSCWYCYDEDDSHRCLQDRQDLLNFEQLRRLVGIFTELGVDNVRLTGGEPLLRRDLHVLVKKLKNIKNLKEVTLTTNGYFLVDKLDRLRKAGLDRINISLDTFRPGRFKQLTGRVGLDHILMGLEKLLASPELHPVKINTVLIEGFNDDELFDFVNWARNHEQTVRFIEFMPLERGEKWDRDDILTAGEIQKRIRKEFELIPEKSKGSRPASRFKIEGGGRVGFISSISDSFCDKCDRIRLTADGKIKNCLFSYNETDIQKVLEGGEDDQVRKKITEAYREKWEGGCMRLSSDDYNPQQQSRTMSRIGG